MHSGYKTYALPFELFNNFLHLPFYVFKWYILNKVKYISTVAKFYYTARKTRILNSYHYRKSKVCREIPPGPVYCQNICPLVFCCCRVIKRKLYIMFLDNFNILAISRRNYLKYMLLHLKITIISVLISPRKNKLNHYNHH